MYKLGDGYLDINLNNVLCFNYIDKPAHWLYKNLTTEKWDRADFMLTPNVKIPNCLTILLAGQYYDRTLLNE